MSDNQDNDNSQNTNQHFIREPTASDQLRQLYLAEREQTKNTKHKLYYIWLHTIYNIFT